MKNILKLAFLLIGISANSIYGQTAPETVSVNSGLILARACPKGSGCVRTWTLASRYGEALKLAESLFGARDYSYTLLGVDFTNEGNPKNWYPFEDKNIIILLSNGSLTDERLALFQLGHETFHVLSPIQGHNTGTTYFEEGLATYFALVYLKQVQMSVPRSFYSNPAKYAQSYDDVVALAKIYPDMAQRIKDFRKKPAFTYISGIDFRQFKQIFPAAPDALAARLTAVF